MDEKVNQISEEERKPKAAEKEEKEQKEKDKPNRKDKLDEKRKYQELFEGCDAEEKEAITKINENEYLLHSGLSNVIINYGSISGGTFQSHQESDIDEEREYDFLIKEDIYLFIDNYKNKKELLDFVALVFLKVIPIFLVSDIRKVLLNVISAKNDSMADEWAEVFGNIEREMYVLNLQRVEAVRKSISGKIVMECFVFEEEISTEYIGKVIWDNYLELRGPILQWLMELKKVKRISEVLFYQIADAFAQITLYDFPYARLEVFSRLRQAGSYQDRNIQVKALKIYISNNEYDHDLDLELTKGVRQKNPFIWQVAYRLYHKEKKYQFQKETETVLKQYWERDFQCFCLSDGETNRRLNDNIDFYPAYYDKEFRRLFIKSIYSIYTSCVGQQDKTQFGYYFCWLLREDLKREGWPDYQLIMLKCLEDKEIRKTKKDMYIEFWRRIRFRRLMGYFLWQNFKELEKSGRPWTYLKEFFKAVAFTGKKADFTDTIFYLEDITRKQDGNEIASEILKWLYSLLKERMEGEIQK